MKSVMTALRDALCAGENAVLVSVIASSGSVPRGEGAKMAVLPRGTVGTIGGGAVEGRCIALARDILAGGDTARTHSFSLAPGGGAELGMVCGGAVEVCFQPLRPHRPEDLAMVEALLAALDRREDAWLATRLQAGRVQTGLYTEAEGLRFLADPLPEGTLLSRAVLRRDGEDLLFVEPVAHASIVYIFGGGHVSQALQPLLPPLDCITKTTG